MKRISDMDAGPVRKNKVWPKIKKILIVIAATICMIFFLLPTVLTCTNFFMSATAIKAQYSEVSQRMIRAPGLYRRNGKVKTDSGHGFV